MDTITRRSGIKRHGLAIEAVGAVVILMAVVIAIFAKYPTPPPSVAYNEMLLAGLVIIVISIPLSVFLKRMGF